MPKTKGREPTPSDIAHTVAPTRLTYGSTFSGIGGLDLAVEHVFGAEPLWHVEPDPYAAAVLRRHWPHVPNLHRIELVDGSAPRPNILCGGFPCQDISLAGEGAGLDGARSGLWWQLARVIEQLEPEIVVLENVAALLARGLGAVLGSLARLGFDAEWGTLRAADVGAPHLRDRVFIVAALPDAARHRRGRAEVPAQRQEAGRDGGEVVDTDRQRREDLGAAAAQAAGRPEFEDTGRVAHGDLDGLEGLGLPRLQQGERPSLRDDAHRRCEAPRWPPARGDAEGWARWPGAVPGVRRGAYGLPRGLDARRRRARVRCLGNAVVITQAVAAISELWGRLAEVPRG